MDLLLQRCFDGLFNGAIYASLAIAIVMIYRSTGLLNFAQGEIALVGGYITLVLLTPGQAAAFVSGVAFAAQWVPWHPWPPVASIAAAICCGAVLGAVIERFVMRRVDGRSEMTQVNATIGLLIFLNGITFSIWGPSGRVMESPFPNAPDDFFLVGGARLRFSTLGVWSVLITLMIGFGLILRHTKAGLAFRAITSNRESAALVGVPINRTLLFGWASAAGVGALAASLVGSTLILQPVTMMNMLIYAFAAATIGGLDSPLGAIVGGVIVGLTQSIVPGYFGVPTELTILPPLAAMIIVLLVRPHGLFGTRPVSRV